MRDEGRDVDEVAGASFGHEFELVAPAHTRFAAHHVDHALYWAVVMGARLGLGVDDDGAGPEFLGAGARVGDGGGAVHARGLRGVDVELVGMDDAHAGVFPFRGGGFTHGGGSFSQYCGARRGHTRRGKTPGGGKKKWTVFVTALCIAAR